MNSLKLEATATSRSTFSGASRSTGVVTDVNAAPASAAAASTTRGIQQTSASRRLHGDALLTGTTSLLCGLLFGSGCIIALI